MSPAVGRETLIGSCPNGIQGTFWQTSFWDHFFRGDERLDHVVEYVLNNPVRAGLVERWCDYPFSGSSVFELADVGGGQAPALQRKLNSGLLTYAGQVREMT